MDHRYFITSKK